MRFRGVTARAVLAAAVHVGADAGIGWHGVLLECVGGLGGDRFRLEYEVAQAVEDGFAVVDLNSAELMRAVADDRVRPAVNGFVGELPEEFCGFGRVAVQRLVRVDADDCVVGLAGGFIYRGADPLHVSGVDRSGKVVLFRSDELQSSEIEGTFGQWRLVAKIDEPLLPGVEVRRARDTFKVLEVLSGDVIGGVEPERVQTRAALHRGALIASDARGETRGARADQGHARILCLEVSGAAGCRQVAAGASRNAASLIEVSDRGE